MAEIFADIAVCLSVRQLYLRLFTLSYPLISSYWSQHMLHRFNVIAPALIDTPMSERASHDPEILAYLAAKQPMATRT